MTAVSAFIDTWRLLLRAPLLFLTIGLVGYLLILVLQSLILGVTLLGLSAINSGDSLSYSELFVFVIVIFLFELVMPLTLSAVLHLAAWDVIAGRRPTIGDHIKLSLKCLPEIFLLSLIVGAATLIGLLFLVIPGFYAAAALSVVIPAIVLGGAGFNAIYVSLGLTVEYRWSIAGGLLLMIISLFFVVFFVEFVFTAVGLGFVGTVLSGSSQIAIPAIFATHVYATLGSTAMERA